MLLRRYQHLCFEQASDYSIPVHRKSKSIAISPKQGEDGWKPTGCDIAAGQGYESDTDRDLQAPDLYIPLMSFVTFIFLIGIELGQKNT